MNPAARIARDKTISHVGMPNGMRATITIGEVSGNIDVQKATLPIGSAAATMAKMRPNMIGKTANDVNWLASWILSTAEPTAAKIDE